MVSSIKRLALISPTEYSCNETFIKLHRERLNGEIHYLYGGLLPLYVNNGEKLIPDRMLKRLFFILSGRVTHPKLNERESALFRYLTKSNIDAVLAEYGQTGASVLNVCRYSKIPLIVHFHGHDAYVLDHLKRYKKKYMDMFVFATTIISVSKDMTEQLITLGCPSDKIVYNPCGPNEKFFSLTNRFKNKNFLAVGRFVDKKAPQLTLNAFKMTLLVHPDANLIMVGDGPLLEECKNKVIAWGIDKSVHFKGALPQKEILKYFEECIAFVQHSITPPNGDSEGTPVSILEAGAAGLAVIATRHAGIKDVVIDGETGYLIDEFDTKAMSNYMIKLASRPNIAAGLGRAAKERVYNNFNISSHISAINKIIEDAIYSNKHTR